MLHSTKNSLKIKFDYSISSFNEYISIFFPESSIWLRYHISSAGRLWIVQLVNIRMERLFLLFLFLSSLEHNMNRFRIEMKWFNLFELSLLDWILNEWKMLQFIGGKMRYFRKLDLARIWVCHYCNMRVFEYLFFHRYSFSFFLSLHWIDAVKSKVAYKISRKCTNEAIIFL